MSQEFIAVLDYMEKERGIKRELLYEAVHAALLAAARKSFGPARDLSVELDQKTGKIDTGNDSTTSGIPQKPWAFTRIFQSFMVPKPVSPASN